SWSNEDWRTRSKFTLWSGPDPEPSQPPQGRGKLTPIGGIAWVLSFAALGALLVLLAEPLWDGASRDSKTWQIFKQTQHASLSTGGSGAASAKAPIQQGLLEQSSIVRSSVRGLTDKEIRFGISAPFSGPAKELGQNMKIGIEAAFNAVNASGGVHGRQLRLMAADDGYEPSRTAEAMKRLYEND